MDISARRPNCHAGQARIVPPVRSVLTLALALAFAHQTAAADAGAVAQGEARDSAQQLPTISVTATGESGTLQNLDAPVNAGALGNLTQLETPFSTTVVTHSDLDERPVVKLGDLFVTDASVSDNSGAHGAWASYLTVRGLQLDWQNAFRIDGKPFLSYATTPPFEHFEQVELLKGASGFMYGFGSPGGLVNYVTKKPTSQPVRSVSLGFSSDSIWRQHVDLGGRAGGEDRFGYRLNATHEQGHLYNGGSLKRNAVSLALDARLTDRLTWDFQSLYQDKKVDGLEPTIYTASMAGPALPRPIRDSDRTLVGNGPFLNNEFQFYSTGLKYRLASDWVLSTSYSHSTTRTRRNESVLFLKDGLGNYDDYRSDYAERYAFDQWQAMVQGSFATGPLEHQVVVGTSWQKQRNDYSVSGVYALTGTGSLWSQNTNSYYPPGGLDLYRAGQITQKAVFASDTVKLSERWSVLAGVRHTKFRQENYTVAGATSSVYDKNSTTPTVALMFRPDAQTMAYASYVESLEQGATVGSVYVNRGETLSPLKSKQYEVGIKTERSGWAATAALFRIERAAEYANAANELVQDGLSIYQGLELGASSRFGAWRVGGNLMLLDTEYRRGTDYTGNRVAGTPRFIAAGQVAYSVPQVPGLTLRADFKYTGSTMLRPANDVRVAGYTIVNVGVGYETRIGGYETIFRAAVTNLADKRYWEFQYADYVKPGYPRALTLGATLKF
nr:TonB-dependent receptor [Pigmentiphaga sp. NML080357]